MPGLYDEVGNPLDQGLGLASSTEASSVAMPDLGGESGYAMDAGTIGDQDVPMFDRGQGTAGRPGEPQLLSSDTSSLGFTRRGARTQSERDYLASLPAMQKVGLAMRAFKAGVDGRPSPVEELLANKRAEDREARREMMDNTTILTKAFEEVRKYGGPGTLKGRAILNAYKEGLGPRWGKTLDAIGTENEDTAKSLTGLVSDPDVQAALIKACGKDSECWQKMVGKKDWLKEQYQTVDTKRLAGALPKVRAFKEQVLDKGGLNAEMDADGKYKLSWPELVEGNAKLKVFTDAEMDTFRRNPEYLIPYGIKTTKALSAGEVEAAKQGERGTKDGAIKSGIDEETGRPATLRYDASTGEWETQAVRAAPAGKGPKPAKPDKPLTLAQEAADEKVRAARERLAKYTPTEIELMMKKDVPASPGSLNPVANPKYDPEIARLKRLAGNPLNADIKARRGGSGAAPAATPAAASAPKTAPTIRTKAEFDALPKGSEFIDAKDGKRKRKG